jgi:hypothetical protein
MRVRKVDALVVRIRDSMRLLADANDDGTSSDTFIRSIQTQLGADRLELHKLLVQSNGAAAIKLLAQQAKLGVLLPRAQAKSQPDATSTIPVKTAAQRKKSIRGGALGKAVMNYGRVRPQQKTEPHDATDGPLKDEGRENAVTNEAPVVPKEVPEKPWLTKRKPGAIEGEKPASGSSAVDSIRPRTDSINYVDSNGQWAHDVVSEPSARYRVVVEVVQAQNLIPAPLQPGAVASGPGMVKDGTGAELTAPDPQARDCFVQGFVQRGSNTPTPKVVGKKVASDVCRRTLNPSFKKRFVFALPLRSTPAAMASIDNAPLYSPVACPHEWDDWSFSAEILDADRFSLATFMGQVAIPFASIEVDKSSSGWFNVSAARTGERVRGKLFLRFMMVSPDSGMYNAAVAKAREAAVESKKDGMEQADVSPKAAAQVRPAADLTATDDTGSNPVFLKRRSKSVRGKTVDYSHVQAKTQSRLPANLVRGPMPGKDLPRSYNERKSSGNTAYDDAASDSPYYAGPYPFDAYADLSPQEKVAPAMRSHIQQPKQGRPPRDESNLYTNRFVHDPQLDQAPRNDGHPVRRSRTEVADSHPTQGRLSVSNADIQNFWKNARSSAPAPVPKPRRSMGHGTAKRAQPAPAAEWEHPVDDYFEAINSTAMDRSRDPYSIGNRDTSASDDALLRLLLHPQQGTSLTSAALLAARKDPRLFEQADRVMHSQFSDYSK